jgi:uncharacterized protein
MKGYLLGLGLMCLASTQALAIDSDFQILADQSVMIVVGNGEIQAMPDLAYVMANVTTSAKTAREAQSLNASATKRLVDSMVAKFSMDKVKDISTSSYNVAPEYKETSNGNRILVGYSVKHALSIKVNNLSLVGAVIDHAGENGGLVNYIQFGLSNAKALEREALKAAMTDATQRAQTIAAANGRTIGRLVKVSEVSYHYEAPGRDIGEEDSGDGTEIYPDLVTISASLTVEYEF